MRTAIASYSFGEILNKVLPFLFIPYLTYSLGVEGFADWVVLESFLYLFLSLILLGQDSLVIKTRIRRNFTFYLASLRIALWVVVWATVAAICVVFLSPLPHSYLLVVATASCFAVFTIALLHYQAEGKVKIYLVGQMLMLIGGLLFTVLLFEAIDATPENRILGILSGLLIANSFLVLKFLNSDTKSFRKHNTLAQYRYHFLIGAPMLIHALAQFSRVRMDKLILVNFYADFEFSNYSLASSVCLVVPVLYLAAYKAIVPELYKGLEKGTIKRGTLIKMTLAMVGIGVAAAFFVLLIPNGVFSIVFGEDFSSAQSFMFGFLISFAWMPLYLVMINLALYLDLSGQIVMASIAGSLSYIVALFALSYTGFSIAVLPYLAFLPFLVSAAWMYRPVKSRITLSA